LSMQVAYYTHQYRCRPMKKEVKAECVPSFWHFATLWLYWIL